MLTLGVDLAASDERTAIATVRWSAGRAEVTGVRLGVGDDDLVPAIRAADKAGLDCPLGWPDAFVTFVAEQRDGRLRPPPADGPAWRRRLAYRLTDEVVRAATGRPPLSVSADLLAHVAFRCAALQARLAAEGHPVDRCGDGVVTEVYPAASLHRWGLTARGYKGRGPALGSLVDGLVAAAPWLGLGPYEALCRRSHDAFDAVVAALTARAAALGRTTPPDDAQRATARAEGWVALPACGLGELVSAG